MTSKKHKAPKPAVQSTARSKGNKRTPLRAATTPNVSLFPHRLEIPEILEVESSSAPDSDNKNTGYIAGDDRNTHVEPPSENENALPAHIQSNLPEYRSRRKQVTDLARFHTYSERK